MRLNNIYNYNYLLYLLFCSIFLLNFACSSEKRRTESIEIKKVVKNNEAVNKKQNKTNKSNGGVSEQLDINELKAKYSFDDEIELEMVGTLPHSVNSYTQGLLYYDGYIYESTGQYGLSSLQKINAETGDVVRKIDLPYSVFAEGICLYEGKIYVMTWRERKCFIVNLNNFVIENEISYFGEAWGLERTERKFIMTNGGSELIFLDVNSFSEIMRIEIRENNKLLEMVNELELIGDELWGNVYMHDDIVRINSQTGEVLQRIKLKNLRMRLENNKEAEAMNGIAFNYNEGLFYLTGKNWSKIFIMKVKEK